jgi:hypothetical protein
MNEKVQSAAPAREVVGVLADAAALEGAIVELLAFGFEEAQITLLAGEKAIVEKLGHRYKRVEELEDDPKVPRILYRAFDTRKTAILGSLAAIGAIATAGAIFAGGGALAATLGSGLIGAEVGGFLGGVLGDFVDDQHARYLKNQLDHGGLLLFVRARDEAEEKAAKEILTNHSGRDVHAHAAPAIDSI